MKNDNDVFTKRSLLENIKDIDVSDKQFKNIITFISTFQNNNGTFDLVNRKDYQHDERIYLCDEPTYICTSLYIKAFINYRDWFKDNIGFNKLKEAINICCQLKLMGHGYYFMETEIYAMKIFIKNGLKQFLNNYPDINPDFTQMITDIIDKYYKMRKSNNYNCLFGSYEKEVKEILDLYEN